MKRHPDLAHLSREHHPALVLAQRARRAGTTDRAFAAELVGRFARELEPHFQVEEQTLLPALAAAGEVALVARTLADHRTLAALAGRIAAGEGDCLRPFGECLAAHVRFEEQELFPRAEAVLDAATLAGLRPP